MVPPPTISYPSVEHFNGTTAGQSAARWIRSIDLHPFVSVSSFLAFVDTKLTGAAADWADENLEIRALLDKADATEQDKSVFKQRFLTRWHSTTPNFSDNTVLTQTDKESVMDFYKRVLARLQQVGGADEVSSTSTGSSRANSFILQQHINMFMSGLKDSRLSYELGKTGPGTLEEACKYAMKLQNWFTQADSDPRYQTMPDRARREYSPRNRQVSTYPQIPSSMPTYSNVQTPNVAVPNDSPSSTPYGRTMQSSQDARVSTPIVTSVNQYPNVSAIVNRYKDQNVLCFRCGEFGHYKDECIHPNPPPYNDLKPKIDAFLAERDARRRQREMLMSATSSTIPSSQVPAAPYASFPPTPRPSTPFPPTEEQSGPLPPTPMPLQVRNVSWAAPVADPNAPAADDGFFKRDPLKPPFNVRMASMAVNVVSEKTGKVTKRKTVKRSPADRRLAEQVLTPIVEKEQPTPVTPTQADNVPNEVLSDTPMSQEETPQQSTSSPAIPPPPKVRVRRLSLSDPESPKEKVAANRRTTRKPSLATIKGMIGKSKIDMADILMTSNITIPMLQFLQASPQSRKEVASLLTVPRGKNRKTARELFHSYDVTVHDSTLRTTTIHGSFFYETFFRNANLQWDMFRRVVYDYGADMNLVIPRTLDVLQAKMYSIKGTKYHQYSFKPVTGPPVELAHVVDLQMSVGGIETTTQFFVIPDRVAHTVNYSALLGLPHAYQVKGVFDVSSMTITMTDPSSGAKVVLNGPHYKPIDPIPIEELNEAGDTDIESYYDDSDSDAYDTVNPASTGSDEEVGEESEPNDDFSTSNDELSNHISGNDTDTILHARLCCWHEDKDEPPHATLHDVDYYPLHEYAKNFADTDWGQVAKDLDQFTWQWFDDDTYNIEPCELGFMVCSAPLQLNEDCTLEPPQTSGFPTTRRVERRSEDDYEFPDEEILLKWVSDVGLEIGEEVMQDVEWRLKILRLCYMWRDIGAQSIADMTVTDLVVVQPWFKGTPVPYACKFNKRLTPEAEAFFMDTIRKGLASGKYIRTFSEWNAPTVVAYKPSVRDLSPSEIAALIKIDPSKVFRLTHNYRFLNKQVTHAQTRMELPTRVTDVLAHPKNRVYMSVDLKNAYWLFPIHPRYWRYFTTTAPDGLQYAPTTMPQGFAPSPFYCAEGVAIAFGEIPEPDPEPALVGEHFRMYQDDGAAGFETVQELFDFLRDHLFPRIKWARFNVSWSKVQLFMTKFKHLGLVYESGGKIHIDPARVTKIMNYPTPLNTSMVRSFVQACQICRPHIRNFAEMARPLTRLTGTKVEFIWRKAIEETSFDMVKHAVRDAVERHGFDNELSAILESDGSDRCGGGVIKQRKLDGIEVVILYDSFVLSPAETRYGTFKKELCVIIHLLKKWRCYLGGIRPTIVRSDHQPLLGFQDSAGRGTVEGIYARWAEILEESNVTWEYIPGPKNKGADAMSHTIFPDTVLLGPDPSDDFEFHVRTTPVSLDVPSNQIAMSTQDIWNILDPSVRDDPWYTDHIKYILFGTIPEDIRNTPAKSQAFKRQCRWFQIKDNHLYRKHKKGIVRCCYMLAYCNNQKQYLRLDAGTEWSPTPIVVFDVDAG